MKECLILSDAFSASIEIILFVSDFDEMLYHIYWFVSIQPFLHSLYENNLIMLNDLFNVLLNLACKCLRTFHLYS
jgi:hypothetical protein